MHARTHTQKSDCEFEAG